MDIVSIISELRKELERIDGLILALEALQAGRRRGRPPKALQKLRAGPTAEDTPAVRRAAKAVQEASAKKAGKKRAKKAAGKKATGA